jgi:CheY-like chemotaxis protein
MDKILIIDDSDIVLQTTKAALEDAGFRVVAVSLFGAGLAAASSLAELLTHSPDAPRLILMDVNMPGIEGDAITELFKRAWGIEVPVYLYSALEADELEERAQAVGAEGYILKSKGLEHLVQRVGELLG